MITDDQIRAIARLARLDMPEDEISLQRRHINALLLRIEAMQRLPLDAIVPTSHCVPLTDVLRDDTASESTSRSSTLANAPEARDGHFIVPRILES